MNRKNNSNSIEWCIVRLGKDFNWWIKEINIPIQWDWDGLSIIDPRQVKRILESFEPLVKYGAQREMLKKAFKSFQIEKQLDKNELKLQLDDSRSILDSEEQLFAFPNRSDENGGFYGDFLDHVTKLRIQFLNKVMDFHKNLEIEELEEDIQNLQHENFIEGKSIHAFKEIIDILEYTPSGFDEI